VPIREKQLRIPLEAHNPRFVYYKAYQLFIQHITVRKDKGE